MKRLLVLLIIIGAPTIQANPVLPPPVISELLIINDTTWYLEVVFQSSYPWWNSTLNGSALQTNEGIAYFKDGIHIIPDSVLILTQDSMQSSLIIKRAGDILVLPGLGQFIFGNIIGSRVTAPLPGQSLVTVIRCCNSNYGWETEYITAKDNTPSIGFHPFAVVNGEGTLSGRVLDKQNSPVPSTSLGRYSLALAPQYWCGKFLPLAYTDSAGYFSVDFISGIYFLDIYKGQNGILGTVWVTIEPDSVIFCDIQLDTVLVGMEEITRSFDFHLRSFPNPVMEETMISFNLPPYLRGEKALIKIYTAGGEMLKILPVQESVPGNNHSISWDQDVSGGVSSGIYICTLEIAGTKVATTKIIKAE
jgi:hypothetical protein